MNRVEYKNWLKNTADIPETISVVSEIENYPYCMLFHLIRSMKTDKKEDKTTLAILHPERRILKNLLSRKITVNTDNIVKKKAAKDDNEEKMNIIKQAAAEFRSKEDLMDILQQRLAELDNKPNKENETPSAEEALYEPQASVSLDELIEKFNQFPPKVSYNPTENKDEQQYKDLGRSSLFERSNIVSETLAELYYKQGAFAKAIKIYEALMQKYPEKSVIFAELIRNINEKK